jgi:hypothetical protein
MGLRGRIGGGLAVLGVMLVGAAPAGADIQFVRISEVYPGISTNPGAEAVELQLMAAGQDLTVATVGLLDFEANYQNIATFASNPPNVESQRTILAATRAFELATGVQADVEFRDDEDALDPNAGSVCLTSSASGGIDCVTWGTGFPPPLVSPVGNPAVAIPEGQSLHRDINRFCPNFLDFFDDRNNSAIDFFPGTPTLRPNALPIASTPCIFVSDDDGGGDSVGDGSPPETTITKKPHKRTTKKRVRVAFKSSEAGSAFACKLDRRPYKPCASPFRKRVDIGKHKFKVRAINEEGTPDPTPAKAKFRRLARP